MEDQFANILQRNYGLKAVGKSASLGPRSDDRASASARALDRGKSVGSGLGRINQSAAAAVFAAAGEGPGAAPQEYNNGLSKSSAASMYGSTGDQGFRGPAQKSSSVGGYDEIFNGSKSGSASSSSFAEFLDGSFGKSMPRSSDSPYSEDVPAVSYQGRSRTTEQAGQSANEEEGLRNWSGRRGSRLGDLRRSTEEDFLDSPSSREARTSHHVASGYDSLKVQTPKSTVSLESESPLRGSFMGGFGRSRTGRVTAQFSPRTVELQVEGMGGDGSNGVLGSSQLNVESNHKVMSGVSSASESESVGRVDSSMGFMMPSSNGSSFLDLNEPYAPSGMDLPTRRLREVKVSNADGEAAVPNTVDSKYPLSPKTPAPDSAKSKDSPSSGPGPFGGDGQSSRGVGMEEGVPMRRAFDLNSVDSPMASPSFVQRSRRSGRGNMTGHSNGLSSNNLEDEPLMKFEVNLASGGATRRGRRKMDMLTEVWLTVDQIRLVTKPSMYPPPSRPPPPPPPPLVRENLGSNRQGSRPKSRGPETSRHEGSVRSDASATESKQQQQQHLSPGSESSGLESFHPGQKVQARSDVERQHHSNRQAQSSGSERANGGGVQKQHGFVLPEVTVVEIGAEIHQKPIMREAEIHQKPIMHEPEIHQKPVIREAEIHQKPITREERERMVAQMDRAARRAKREEERLKEKERLQREGLSQSLFNDPEVREPSRSRAGRDKVFYPKDRQVQDPVSRKEEEIQYRVQRQQARELQERLGRQEGARDRESERSADRMRRSAEKAALEAQERAERAAVERAVQEAHERAEKAARQRAAAARMKEKERERERERDREEEKLRDRLREKERGLAEQLRSRDGFRATSEPRQRPTVSGVNPPSGLSRFSSGENLNKYSGTGDSRKSPSGRQQQRASKEWGASQSQVLSIPEKFQEIPGEPADRRKLRLEKQLLIEERAARALQEKNMRDLALQREQEERQRFASSLDADVRRWSVGKEGNLRALLSTLHMMLWAECNWKVVSMSDLASGPAVKKAYQRAILCVHPDKVQQKGANVKQKYIAEKVFDLLKDAYAKFNNELY